jgi:FAD/FMN-containing dehydrogenase
MHAKVSGTPSLIARLEALIGRDYVITEPREREFFSTDVYRRGEMPLVVVRPGSTREVAGVVELALEHGTPLVPRGGGASYTDGYTPAEPDSILIDTSRLNRILEINAEDMYVTAEAGVTWAALNAALAAKGLRTPFYGPFSGIAATVGGSLSQNSVSWGTGLYGVSAESVLGFEVVLGNGQVLHTGSWGAANASPFFRQYGPDVTGLFTGDCGAFGIKTGVTLRLIRRPAEFLGLSFGFRDFQSLATAMTAAAKEGLNTLNFGLDPRLQSGQLGRATVSDGFKAAAAVFRSSRNPVDGLVQVAKIGMAGRSFLKGAMYSAHYIVEGVDRPAVRSSAARLREVLGQQGAEIAATVPTVIQATPFMPLFNIRGPKGERWVPIHGILPFSRVAAFHAELQGYYAGTAERMRVHKVDTGAMFMTASTNAFLYEPVFYWEDIRTVNHERMVPAEHLRSLPAYGDNPQGRALVQEMRTAIAELFHEHGAAHLQIGRLYPYLRGRESESTRVLQEIKSVVDPRHKMNPGALGL